MREKKRPRISDENWVCWRDPQNAEVYGSDEGPFPVVKIALDIWTPVCTCGGKNSYVPGSEHSMFCEGQFEQVEGLAVTVLMNGRHRTFPEELFEVVKRG